MMSDPDKDRETADRIFSGAFFAFEKITGVVVGLVCGIFASIFLAQGISKSAMYLGALLGAVAGYFLAGLIADFFRHVDRF